MKAIRRILKDGKPVGHTCPECNTKHPWPLWLFAHWTIDVSHSCPKCSLTTHIRLGRVTRPG